MIMKKIVEFAGLPGSGKTYILKRLQATSPDCCFVNTEDYYSYQKHVSKIILLFKTICFIVWHINVLKEIHNLHNPHICIKQYLEILFYLYTYRKVLQKYERYDTIVFDQGVLQKLWFYFYSNNESVSREQAKIIGMIVKMIIPSCVLFKVVYFDTPIDLAISRATNRKGDCFADHLSLEVLNKMYSSAIEDKLLFGEMTQGQYMLYCDENDYETLNVYINN